MRSPRSPPPFRDDPRRAELQAIYAEVDALLADFSCDSSTECCRFGITGREPYPTAVERAEMARAMSEKGIPRRRPLPLAPRGSVDERACPLLSSEGRCTIYAARPFGCRTFLCHRAAGPGKIPRDEIQRLSRRIQDLSERWDPADPGPRPLTRAVQMPTS